MTNADVTYLMQDMPEDSPLLARIRQQYFQGEEHLSASQRLLYPMKNAALGFDLVSAHFHSGVELPTRWGFPDLHRAYRCMQNETEAKRVDPACLEAMRLGHPANMHMQEALKGYLCAGLSYEQVSVRCGKSGEVVRIFAHLHCDFSELCDSPEFVLGLLDPQGERGSFATSLPELATIEDPILRAMNIGYWYGPDVLTEALGKRPSDCPVNENDLLKKLQIQLLRLADLKSLRGSLDRKDSEFLTFLRLIAGQQKLHHDSVALSNPLSALSGAKDVQSAIEAMFKEEIHDQLQHASEVPASAQPPTPSPNI